MEVIVEVVNRGGRAVQHQRFSGTSCRIGRAYDNDIILTEPHVSPQHAVLEADEYGQWWLYDCGSRNGIRGNAYRRLVSPVKVSSGEAYQLGRVWLRFYRPDHPVAETLSLGLTDNILNYCSQPLPVIGQFVFLLFSIFMLEYNRYYDVFDWKTFLPQVLAAPVVALVWAGIWSITGRVLRHEPRFITQLVVAVMYVTSIEWFQPIIENIAFNTGDLATVKLVSYGGHGYLLFLLLALNMRLATHLAGWLRRLAAAGAALLLVGGVALSDYLLQPDFSNAPEYLGALQPELLRWQDSGGLDQALEDAEALFVSPESSQP